MEAGSLLNEPGVDPGHHEVVLDDEYVNHGLTTAE
jgi:hypothetical protein